MSMPIVLPISVLRAETAFSHNVPPLPGPLLHPMEAREFLRLPLCTEELIRVSKSIEIRATSSSPTTNLPRLLSSRANLPFPAPIVVLRRSVVAPAPADTIRRSTHGPVSASAQPLL